MKQKKPKKDHDIQLAKAVVREYGNLQIPDGWAVQPNLSEPEQLVELKRQDLDNSRHTQNDQFPQG